MKKILLVFFVVSFTSFAKAQVLESKDGRLAPDWVEHLIEATIDKIERFKNKYVFFAQVEDEELNRAHNRANRDLIRQIANRIRTITTISNLTTKEGNRNIFEFNDEISAYEVIYDDRSLKIEEDYWARIKKPNGSIVYSYFKIIALERTIVDQKKAQFTPE
jgi:hypothetical protein